MSEPVLKAARAHVPALDGIRGIAIAVVVAFHYVTMPHHHPLGHALWMVARAGWLGVDLFFVLSGFLITGILIESRGSHRYFRDFYVRRTLRIFPLYYAVLAVVFGVLAWLPFMQTASFAALSSRQAWLWSYSINIANVLSQQTLFVSDRFEANHFWSLAAEEQFYIVWPAIVLVLAPRRLALVGIAIVIVAFVARTLVAHSETAVMLLRADALVVGGVIAAALRIPAWRSRLLRAAPWVASLAGIALMSLMFANKGLQHADPIVAVAAPSLVAFGGGALVLVAIHAPASGLVTRALTLSPLMLLGRYSYGLYVIHWAFAPLFDIYLAPWLSVNSGVHMIDVFFLIGVKTALAVALAAASYHGFEKHFLVLKDRYAPTTHEAHGSSVGVYAAAALGEVARAR